MKKLLIASICLFSIALALLGFKLYYIKQELESLHEQKSAVTDMVKVDTMSFEQKLAMADSVLNSKENASYTDNELLENEAVIGTGSYGEELSRVTTHRNGLPEFAISWSPVGGKYKADGLHYFNDEGKLVAKTAKAKYYKKEHKNRWHCWESASMHTNKRGETFEYRLSVDDPRSCLSIKN